MSRHHRVGWILWLGALLLGCGTEPMSPAWRHLDPRIAAPDFTLPSLTGEPVQLSTLRGRIVVMEFWATWCETCRVTLPSLETFSRRYQDKGVTVLLIDYQESASEVRRWAGRRFTAPMLLDLDGRVTAQYRVRGTPTLFVMDRAGRLAVQHEGYEGGLEPALAQVLDSLLAESAPGA